MSNGSELKGRSADALRKAGYLPLPRLWVTEDQMAAVIRMAESNRGEVVRIRREAKEAEKWGF